MTTDILDCVIIGGGPAGLLAATYLGRYCCKIRLIDNEKSRAALIPLSHNFPSYPNGISGYEILNLMREQANKYSDCIIKDTANQILYDKKSKIFNVKNQNSQFFAKKIILATGAADVEPKLPHLTEAIKNGIIRHCIICDGYEIINKKIAIIATGRKAINEAIFLNRYSKDITIFNLGSYIRLSKHEMHFFKENGIKIQSKQIEKLFITENKKISIQIKNQCDTFDHIYSGLGFIANSELAIKLGAMHNIKNKRLITNSRQETNIAGLFAVGDVVANLSQMAVGMCQATIAATAIFNSLLQQLRK